MPSHDELQKSSSSLSVEECLKGAYYDERRLLSKISLSPNIIEKYKKSEHDSSSKRYSIAPVFNSNAQLDVARTRCSAGLDRDITNVVSLQAATWLKDALCSDYTDSCNEVRLRQVLILDGNLGGIMLLRDNIPCVNVAYDSRHNEGGGNTLFIKQLQRVWGSWVNGVRFNLPIPKDIQWPKVLVAVSEEFAALAGIERVAIQSARNNTCINDGTRTNRSFTFEQAKMRYDVTAKRMGYELNTETGNWVKNIRSE